MSVFITICVGCRTSMGIRMKPLISLVIPVYNVEKYLDKCMASVLNQTYPNFEVILVDDGATDKSGSMCDEYENKDPRVKTFHKKNGGLSDARNFGVEHASGSWIAFIDSDDFVTDDYLEYLYNLIEKYDATIACASAMMPKKREGIRDQALTASEALEKMCRVDVIGVSACAKLYPRELLLKHPYPVGRLYEDLATTYKLFAECATIALGTKKIYYYIQRSGSISGGELNEKQYEIFTAATEQLEFISANFPEVEGAAHVRCANVAIQLIPKCLSSSDGKKVKNDFKRIRAYLKPHFSYVLKDNFKSFHFKARCALVMTGYLPTRIVWPLIEHLRPFVSRA